MMETICLKSKGRVFFQKNRIPSKKDVIKQLGVIKNTFAGNMIERMYDYYFDNAIEFKKEYRKYYSCEYSSLAVFIEEHYNIEKNLAKMCADGNYCMKEFSRQIIDYNVETLNYDRDFKQKFSEAVGGIKDEDSDGVYYE